MILWRQKGKECLYKSFEFERFLEMEMLLQMEMLLHTVDTVGRQGERVGEREKEWKRVGVKKMLVISRFRERIQLQS